MAAAFDQTLIEFFLDPCRRVDRDKNQNKGKTGKQMKVNIKIIGKIVFNLFYYTFYFIFFFFWIFSETFSSSMKKGNNQSAECGVRQKRCTYLWCSALVCLNTLEMIITSSL